MSKKIIHFLKNKFSFWEYFKMLPSKGPDAMKPYITINHKDEKFMIGFIEILMNICIYLFKVTAFVKPFKEKTQL